MTCLRRHFRLIPFFIAVTLYASLAIWSQVHAIPHASAADFDVTIQPSKQQIESGDTVVYSITVTNMTGEMKEDIEIGMSLDSSFLFKSASSGGDENDGQITWEEQTFDAGKSKSYNVNVQADPELITDIDAESTVFVEDAFATVNTTIRSKNNQENQDISISLQSSNQNKSVKPKDSVTFTIEITNNGNEPAANVSANLTLNEEIEFRSASSGGEEDDEVVTWNNLRIGAGNTVTLSAVGKITDDVEEGDTIQVSATANGKFAEVVLEIDDPDIDDDDDDRQLEIAITKSAEELQPDQTFSYNIEIKNINEEKINNVSVILELDTNLEFLSASNRGAQEDGTVRWESVEIQGNSSRTLTASVRVKDSAQDGITIESSASAEGAVAEDSTILSDPNKGKEDIRIHLFTDSKTTTVDEDIVYTIRVRNMESEEQTIDVLAFLDYRTNFVSASENAIQIEKYVIEWQDIVLANDEIKSFELAVKPEQYLQAGSKIRLLIEAGRERRQLITSISSDSNGSGATNVDSVSQSEDQSEPVTENAPSREIASRPVQTTSSNQVSNSAQRRSNTFTGNQQTLEVTKEVDKKEISPGSQVVYTINVTNPKQYPLFDLEVYDRIPAGLQILNAPSAYPTPQGLKWLIPELPQGAKWTTRYTALASQNLVHGSALQSTVEVIGPAGHATRYLPSAPARVYNRPVQTGLGGFTAAVLSGKSSLTFAKKAPIKTKQIDTQITKSSSIISLIGIVISHCMIVILLLSGITIGARLGRKSVALR